MNEEKKLLTPGMKEFDELIKGAGDLTALSPSFTEEELGGGTYMRWSVLPLTDVLSKVVVHVCRCPLSLMEKLSPMLHRTVKELDVIGSQAEAGPSPMFAKRFDFVLYNIPSVQAEALRNIVLTRIRETAGR